MAEQTDVLRLYEALTHDLFSFPGGLPQIFVAGERNSIAPSAVTTALVVGIDLGTQGVRVAVLDLQGALRADASEPFPALAPDSVEQDPESWWTATCRSLRRVTAQVDPSYLQALCITSTSGTIVLLDERDRPLRPALLYNDGRAAAEAEALNAVLGAAVVRPTDPPAKLLWVSMHEPAVWGRVARIVHAADLIGARLTGEWATDWSHALKSGYDPGRLRWSPVLDAAGVDPQRIPPVRPPGTVVAVVTAAAAEATGLAPGTRVIAGMTDGCTSQIAAGATAPGEWSSTLGTTLVVKGVTADLLVDPLGRVYSHRHPDGFWMPGGASTTGGECLAVEFAGENLRALDSQVESLTPTGLVAYPLVRSGERFPFVAPQARGFLLGSPRSRPELYTAHLEGVAYLERLAYEVLTRLGAEVGPVITTAGGGARSRVWTQIRSDVLGRVLRRPAVASSAAGAAILASMGLSGQPLTARARAMVRIEAEVSPRREPAAVYLSVYERFLDALEERGYLSARPARRL